MSPVGRTRDAGWELGVRRTTAASLDRTWAQLLDTGLATWLGDTTLDLARGAPYTTADGAPAGVPDGVVERLVRDLDGESGQEG